MFRLPQRIPQFVPLIGLALVAACSSEATAPVSRSPGSLRMSTATSTLLVNTGPGGTTTIGSPVVFWNATHWQYLGGQFTLANETNVESLAAWMYVNIGGTVDVHIRSDNAGIPGTDVHSQQYTIVNGAYVWIQFGSYAVDLPAGTYWITLEPPVGSTLNANMPNGAAAPLASYAFLADGNINWSHNFGVTPTMGFQLTGTEVTADPVALINTLIAYVTANTPKAIAMKTNKDLQLAITAINASQTANACTDLSSADSYIQSQSARKVPASVKVEVDAEITNIRTVVGC